jgi:hypothetical protein
MFPCILFLSGSTNAAVHYFYLNLTTVLQSQIICNINKKLYIAGQNVTSCIIKYLYHFNSATTKDNNSTFWLFIQIIVSVVSISDW